MTIIIISKIMAHNDISRLARRRSIIARARIGSSIIARSVTRKQRKYQQRKRRSGITGGVKSMAKSSGSWALMAKNGVSA